MLAGVTDVGGVGKGAAEEDWRWDLNPGVAAIETEDYAVLEKRRERTTRLWQRRRREPHSFGRVGTPWW